MRRASSLLVVGAAIGALACASTRFVASWKAPDAVPLQVEGARVAAVAMMESEAARRAAEDTLARELRKRGAEGIPMYRILPDPHPEEEGTVRMALQRANVQGIVVMRPVAVTQDVHSISPTFNAPFYRGYWGGYYPYGWTYPWDGAEIRTDTVVSIETLVYSLPQNKLVWGGVSRTTNPSTVDELVTETAEAVADELRKQNLIAQH